MEIISFWFLFINAVAFLYLLVFNFGFFYELRMDYHIKKNRDDILLWEERAKNGGFGYDRTSDGKSLRKKISAEDCRFIADSIRKKNVRTKAKKEIITISFLVAVIQLVFCIYLGLKINEITI